MGDGEEGAFVDFVGEVVHGVGELCADATANEVKIHSLESYFCGGSDKSTHKTYAMVGFSACAVGVRGSVGSPETEKGESSSSKNGLLGESRTGLGPRFRPFLGVEGAC